MMIYVLMRHYDETSENLLATIDLKSAMDKAYSEMSQNNDDARYVIEFWQENQKVDQMSFYYLMGKVYHTVCLDKKV